MPELKLIQLVKGASSVITDTLKSFGVGHSVNKDN